MSWIITTRRRSALVTRSPVSGHVSDAEGHVMFRKTRAAVLGVCCLLALAASPVSAAVPTNDDSAGAIVVGSLPYSNTQDTTDATTSSTDTEDCGDGLGPTVWYAYTATQDGPLEVNTLGSSYSTTLHIESSALFACGLERILFDAEAGMTYLFMVGSLADGPGGTLVFNLFDTTDLLPKVTATLDRIGQLDANDVPTLTGTFTCSGGDRLSFSASMEQDINGHGRFGEGQGLVRSSCAATGTWSMPINIFSTTFFPGPAHVLFRASACNSHGCTDRYLDKYVYLH